MPDERRENEMQANKKIPQNPLTKINLRKYTREIILVFYPVALLLADRKWIVNKNDIDVWFYNGYFSLPLNVFQETSPTVASQYFDTRLPFTLLGHLVYSVFPESQAKIVFNLGIMHVVIILTVYTLMKKISYPNNAFVGAMLLSTNVFYLRMIGSDYVDLGVVFYLSITLLLIHRNIPTGQGPVTLTLIGFTLICMLLTNPLSIFLMPLVVIYGVLHFPNDHKKASKNFYLKISGWISLGSIFSLIFFQVIYLQLTGRHQFILLPTFYQIRIPTEIYQGGFSNILNNSPWNRMLFFAILLSALHSVFRSGKIKTKIQKFWIYSPLLFLTYLFFTSSSTASIFLSRDGLYVSFLFIFVSMSLLVNLFNSASFKNLNVVIISGFIVVLNFFNLIYFQKEIEFETKYLNSLQFTVIASSILFLVSNLKRFNFQVAGTVTAILLVFFQSTIQWKFDGNSSVVDARRYIMEGEQKEIPFFFLRRESDDFANFASIPASFSAKGWWKTNLNYPDCIGFVGTTGFLPNSNLVIISRSKIVDSSDFSLFKDCLGSIEVTSEKKFNDNRGVYYIAKLKIPKTLFSNNLTFIGSSLPTVVGFQEGNRMAAGSETKAGVLTFGPYLILEPGSYNVVIEYSSNSLNSFDAVGTVENSRVVLKVGELKSTGSTQKLDKHEFEIVISERISAFEVRTIYSGQGVLKIEKILVDKLQ